MSRIVAIVASLLVSITLSGQQVLEVTPSIQRLYNLTAALQLDKAQYVADSIKKVAPNNMLVYHMEHYIDFYEIFITEDEALFDQREDNLSYRLDLIDQADSDSPYFLFCQAEMELMWALVRLKWDQKYRAGRGVLRAYRLLEKNVDLYPDFKENYKSLSIIHAMSESLPAWLRTIIGISGNISEGTHEILSFVDYAKASSSLWYREGVVVASYMLFYLNNEKDKAWALLSEHDLDIASHPLLTFIYSNMAQRTGKNDLAISILEQRSTSDDILNFAYLDLLLGKSKLYRLDEDADKYIHKYLQGFRGQHFVKEAYQKLAWHALAVQGDADGYHKYIGKCLSYGAGLTDEDKQAAKEAESGQLPDQKLLRARLLFDGGYLHRAHRELILAEASYPSTHPMRDEYLYRLGRVLQGLGNPIEAIQYYDQVITLNNDDSYQRCNAALQIGLILERHGRYTEALRYLNKCLAIPSETYRTSLHQKAKAGIERVERKAMH